MPRRPRILLLARSFPPTENIASVRTKNIAKHLSRLGWHVTVVTVDPRLLVDPGDEAGTRQLLACEGIERITTRHRLGNLVPGFVRVGLLGSLRPVAGLTRLLGRWLDVDSGYGWIRPVLKSCRRLQPGDVDVIVASGPPYASFVAAEVLAKRLQCPFALDYRDPWTQSSYRWNRPRARSFRAERRLVAGCSLITTVSPNLAEGFKQVFGVGEKVHVLTNGFDPEDLEGIRPTTFDHFALVYAGSFDPPPRVVTPLLRAIKLARAKAGSMSPMRFHYYGRQSKHVIAEAHRLGVDQMIVDHGQVSRAEALSAVKGAGAVAVVTSVLEDSAHDARGIVTGKVFEALGLGAPILLVAPEGSDAAAIVEGTGGGRRSSASDVAGMASFLEAARAGRWTKREGATAAYEWPNLARQLDQELRRVVARGANLNRA